MSIIDYVNTNIQPANSTIAANIHEEQTIAEMALGVGLTRFSHLNNMVQDNLKKMEQQNNTMAELNKKQSWLGAMGVWVNDKDGYKKSDLNNLIKDIKQQFPEREDEVHDFITEMGLGGKDRKSVKDKLQEATDNIRRQMELNTGMAQTDMVKLQSAMNKLNVVIEQVSSIMSRYYKGAEFVVSNIR